MKFDKYRKIVAIIVLVWGILNLTNGFSLFAEWELNIAKGLCGIILAMFIVFVDIDEISPFFNNL